MVTAATRAAAELQRRLMTETITVAVETGSTFDADLGRTIPVYIEGVYAGIARAAITQPGSPDLVNAELATVPTVAVTLPLDSPALPNDARIRITSSLQPGHPLVGVDVWITDETTGSTPTARRYLCRRVK